MNQHEVYVAIAFFSTNEPGAPLRLILAYRTNCLDVARTLYNMGASYIRVYDNAAAYKSDNPMHSGFSWTY